MVIGSPPLVPEVQLRLASTGIETLWAQQADRAPPYYAFPWAGGQALARYLLDHPTTVSGLRVLDLGTGSGLCAIAAALAGARSVLATDIDPRAVLSARENATLNCVNIEVVERDVLDEELAVDVIVVGDCFYEQPLAGRVLAFIDRSHATALLGDPGRAYFSERGLERVARYEVQSTADLEGRSTRAAAVYRVR